MVSRSAATIKHKQFYMVTIRKHCVKEYVPWEELDGFVQILAMHLFKIRDYCFESHGMYKQLHCHMLIEVDSRVFRYKRHTKFFSKLGYFMHFQVWNNPLTAKKYIHKHCKYHSIEQLDQIYHCNYYKYHCFV